MLRFYYNPAYKYTNRMIIEVSQDTSFVIKDVVNIDSADTINAHIIYDLTQGEQIPTYIIDDENERRYFVSGIRQLRSGKFQLSLIRDIVSESSNWLNERAYISAGTATDFNKYKIWNLPFTNTKVKEQRLNVNGKSSFFVYYINEQTNTGDVLSEKDFTVKYTSIPGIAGYDYELNNLNEIPSFKYVNAGIVHEIYSNTAKIKLRGYEYGVGGSTPVRGNTFTFNASFSFADPTITTLNEWGSDYIDLQPAVITGNNPSLQNNANNSLNDLNKVTLKYLNDYYNSLSDNRIYGENVYQLKDYVNKIIKIKSTNEVYTIRIAVNRGARKRISLAPTELLGAIRGVNLPKWGSNPISYSTKGNWLEIDFNNNEYEYVLEKLGTAKEFNFTFKSNTRKLPKSAVRCVNIVSSDTVTNEEISQCLMLAQTNPRIDPDKPNIGRIIDIQYLPFSVANKVNSDYTIDGKPIIAQCLENDDYEYFTDLPDLKDINKETDSIKIVSPSRCSQFLFKPYNNNGNMKFNTKITLRPNASIIYVRPSTEGLLMSDWNDKDCLIIQEDFSLTKVTSEWTNYVYNNKNFQNTFNRDIQGREFNREWQRKIEQAQKRSDEWTGRNISASKARTYTGNLPIISGVAGAIGTAFKDEVYMQMAQLDREMNESLYQESVDIAKDMFNYQLENIQSQPLVPTSITTIDVKMLDGIYLEFYSTNETELEAINNFYKYNGNRIDNYGIFKNYLGHFVRGKIIISENYTQPELNELNRRLELGIFTGKEE